MHLLIDCSDSHLHVMRRRAMAEFVKYTDERILKILVDIENELNKRSVDRGTPSILCELLTMRDQYDENTRSLLPVSDEIRPATASRIIASELAYETVCQEMQLRLVNLGYREAYARNPHQLLSIYVQDGLQYTQTKL